MKIITATWSNGKRAFNDISELCEWLDENDHLPNLKVTGWY